ELMLNAVNLTFITFAKMNANMMGQMFVIFVITVAAVEAAVGLALIISLNRRKATLNVDEINILKW
ncbi:MAG: NADH-quinone oxidoreductase subunit NuoK, partial [bacterium]